MSFDRLPNEHPTKKQLEEAYEQQTNRFRLSPEAFARERLQTMRAVLNEVRQTHPEVLSFALFGSMTKATARPESDLDAWIFIDADLAQTQAEIRGETAPVLETYHSPSGRQGCRFAPGRARETAQLIQEKIRKRAHLAEDRVNHIRPLPISAEVIDAGLALMKRDLAAQREYKTNLAAYTERIARKDFTAKRPSRPIENGAYLSLPALFHLSLGNGVRRYRALLLERLRSEPDGEELWKQIIFLTEGMEQPTQYREQTRKRYPRTLAEAQAVYGGSSSREEPTGPT